MSNPVMNRALEEVEKAQAYGASGVEIPQVSQTRMTIAGTMNRTVSLFGVMLLSAAAAWIILDPAIALFTGLVAFALAMWASFARTVRPGVIVTYAVFEGIFLSGISRLFELAYPGIVQTAVLATTVTAGVMFVAYQQRWIQVTARFRSMLSFALLGYLAFALVNFAVVAFTNSTGAYGSSFGWIVSLLGVGLAAFTLVMDFADIEAAAAVGAPEEYEWRFAFGLLVSVVWMYTEILRLLAILRGND